MSKDIYFENQRMYCNNNNLPLFAYSSCNHSYPWNVKKYNYGIRQSLGEILIDKYGEEEALRVSCNSHIISCPGCGKSWCD